MNLYSNKEEIQAYIIENLLKEDKFQKYKLSRLAKVYTFIRAVSNTIYLFIERNLLDVYKSIFPHLAGIDSLHEHLISRNLEWKPAVYARHRIRIGASKQPVYTLEIPQDLIVTTAEEDENRRVKFRTLSYGSIGPSTPQDLEGFYTIEVDVECLTPGVIGNVMQYAIALIEDSPEDDVDTVYNSLENPIVAGEERESTFDVRNRLSQYDNTVEAMFTPTWYIQEAESFVDVKRALFVSANELGIEGHVKLLLFGKNHPLPDTILEEVANHFTLDENSYGGVAHVIVENIDIVSVARTLKVYYGSPELISEQFVLDDRVDNYFYNLQRGEDFDSASVKTLFFGLPGVVYVEITPDENVEIDINAIAVRDSLFSVEGVEYVL